MILPVTSRNTIRPGHPCQWGTQHTFVQWLPGKQWTTQVCQESPWISLISSIYVINFQQLSAIQDRGTVPVGRSGGPLGICPDRCSSHTTKSQCKGTQRHGMWLQCGLILAPVDRMAWNTKTKIRAITPTTATAQNGSKLAQESQGSPAVPPNQPVLPGMSTALPTWLHLFQSRTPSPRLRLHFVRGPPTPH